VPGLGRVDLRARAADGRFEAPDGHEPRRGHDGLRESEQGPLGRIVWPETAAAHVLGTVGAAVALDPESLSDQPTLSRYPSPRTVSIRPARSPSLRRTDVATASMTLLPAAPWS
jgi:hypothetical protein